MKEIFKVNIHELSEFEYEKWYLCMTPEKKKKVDQLSHIVDKKRSIAAEMLVKKGFYNLFGVLPDKLMIDTDCNGKPYVKGYSFHFSLSHSGDYAVCAISDERIGIDIEKILPINYRIIDKVCTKEEKEFIRGQAVIPGVCIENELKRFYAVWTAKEAYLKYLGVGITDDIDQIEIPWNHISLELLDEYIISVYSNQSNED